MSATTLIGLLEGAARSDRGVTFVDAAERERGLPWAQVLASAREVAGGLQWMGIRPGDRVAIVHPTEPEFFDAFFGCLIAGAVPVPLYPPVRLGRLAEYHERTARMLLACRAQLVLCDARTRRVLGETIGRALPPKGCALTAAIPRRDPAAAAVDPDAVAFIQFSSGTTGEPRPVLLTHRAVCANVRAILGAILAAHPETPGRPHVCVSWLPLYHDMGLVGAVLSALAHPGSLVLIPPELFLARPALWLRAISRHRGTISPAPNFAYALCAERVPEAELDGLDLGSWCVAMNGAEPVTPSSLDAFLKRFARCGLRAEVLAPVYGLAEATLAVTFSELGRPFERERFDRDALYRDGRARVAVDGHELVGVGRPLPGFAVRIASESGASLPDGRVGEVQVSGPSLMRGYDGLPEATAAAIRDGWLATGDLGFLHAGSLYLCARAKDVIVLRGRNHPPHDVEQAASEVAGVRTGCVVAVGLAPDGGQGEELFVFAERARGDRSLDLEERVRSRVISRTGLVPAAVRVLPAGALPRTSSGKLRRAETRRLHQLGELRGPGRADLPRLTLAMLRSALGFARARQRAGR
jgi:acyl-CoA synthetase (AMP-forming)/AMP-acid ligase II